MVGEKKSVFILFLLLTGGLLVASELPKPLKEVRPRLLSVGSATLHWLGIHVYDISLYAKNQNYTTNGAAVISICYNGSRLLGEVADAAFGPAFFAIWLDSECRYPKLRDEILKNNKTSEKKGR